jgi:hypothetical protein
MLPVIKAGAFKVFIVGGKAERMYQMQHRISSSAKSGDGTGIRWNFRFHQYNIERVRGIHVRKPQDYY